MLSQAKNNQKKLRQVITKILKEELISENKFLRRRLDTDEMDSIFKHELNHSVLVWGGLPIKEQTLSALKDITILNLTDQFYINSSDSDRKNFPHREVRNWLENHYSARIEERFNNMVRNKKQEQSEGEITEKCWKGYTQKGMKTMFGKRYPNCVKKTLKEEDYTKFLQRRDYCFNKFFDELENNKELIPEVSYQGGYFTFTIISIAFMLRYCEKNRKYNYEQERHDEIRKKYQNRLELIYDKHKFE